MDLHVPNSYWKQSLANCMDFKIGINNILIQSQQYLFALPLLFICINKNNSNEKNKWNCLFKI